nr:hypothetical protein [Tanacetum cinerariifolium]
MLLKRHNVAARSTAAVLAVWRDSASTSGPNRVFSMTTLYCSSMPTISLQVFELVGNAEIPHGHGEQDDVGLDEALGEFSDLLPGLFLFRRALDTHYPGVFCIQHRAVELRKWHVPDVQRVHGGDGVPRLPGLDERGGD